MVDLSNRPHFLWVYWRYNPLGCWENTRKPCKLRAFKVGYQAGKPIEVWSIAFIK